ncbi:MAG: hypothetical protein JHD02_00690 [Thermoleophilaceae bacterium]|nr:hypothetical protein [Thermoleophilaceae bacterium]
MKLNRLHTALRKDFRDLPKPDSLDDFEGSFSALYVGPAPVRLGGPALMAMLGYRGWKGKRFARDGADLKGSSRFGDGEVAADRYPMRAHIGPSAIDGEDALVALYPSDTRKPWNKARDEFREFEDGRLLGITTFDIPVIRHLPLAYVIERE